MYSFPAGTSREEEMSNELCNELASLTYETDAGIIVVESKKKAKLRGISSPNIADALGNTEYFHGIAHRIWSVGDKKKETVKRPWSSDEEGSSKFGRHAWMVQ